MKQFDSHSLPAKNMKKRELFFQHIEFKYTSLSLMSIAEMAIAYSFIAE